MQYTDTSSTSYRQHRASGKLGAQQCVILALMRQHVSPHDGGWSLQEIAKHTGLAVHVISARINELVKIGVCVRSTMTRGCTVTGRSIHPVYVPA